MAKFKDASGREWSLDIRLMDIKRIREATGVDLTALAKDPERFVQVMLIDSHELLPVVWVLLEPQATGLGSAVTEADFQAAVDGDTLDAAVVALWEAFGDFFRRSPIGMRIRQDGAAKAMQAVADAMNGAAADEPAPADPPAATA